MGRLMVFNSVSLDGYYTGANGDLSWAYANRNDAEWNSFVEGNAKGEGMLLFGRVTYDMMVSYWPTPAAQKDMPVIAAGMNRARKIVFSRTLDTSSWNNTRVVRGDIAAEVRKLKQESGPGMVILGSGSIVAQLVGLIDEYQFVVIPVVIGSGKTMFEGIQQKINLKLTKTRTFGNGNVLLCYQPKA